MPPKNLAEKRRKRVVLTVMEKLKIIQKRQNGECISKLAREYNIGEQTVRDILHNKDKLLNFVSASCPDGTFKRKTLKMSYFPHLDTALFKWFLEKRAEGTVISGPLLLAKATALHEELGIQKPFYASPGWLTRFKNRHGIRLLGNQNENISGDPYNSDSENLIKNSTVTLDNFDDGVDTNDGSDLFWKSLQVKQFLQKEETTRESDGSSENLELYTKLSSSEAISYAENVLLYLKQQECGYNKLENVNKTCTFMRNSVNKGDGQRLITDYSSVVNGRAMTRQSIDIDDDANDEALLFWRSLHVKPRSPNKETVKNGDESSKKDVINNKVILSEAVSCAETVLMYLKQESDEKDIDDVNTMCNFLNGNVEKDGNQRLITDYFENK